MDSFLYSIGLIPLHFDEARKLTGKATPFVLEVVERGLSITQATVVLMTMDDVGCLRHPFRAVNEPTHETQLTAKPRQSVIFEAGMAMALRPNQTVLVELGGVHAISDLAGFHVIRMDNSIEKRKMLADSLETAKCRVDRSGDEWKSKEKGGDFDAAIEASKGNMTEMKDLLREELQRLEGRAAEPVREQPRLLREQARRRRPLSERKAIKVALNALETQFKSIGLGRLEAVKFTVVSAGRHTKLVEGDAYTMRGLSHGRAAFHYRVLVKEGSKGEVMYLQPKRTRAVV